MLLLLSEDRKIVRLTVADSDAAAEQDSREGTVDVARQWCRWWDKDSSIMQHAIEKMRPIYDWLTEWENTVHALI